MTMKETWKPVTIGGMTGILMGAGTMFASQSLTTDEMPVVKSSEKPLMEASVGGSQSFREAFQAARAELGPGGVFRWHGNIYNTYTVEEWNAMSKEEKDLFAQRVKPEISPADIDTDKIAETESELADDNVQEVQDQKEADTTEEEKQVAEAVATTEESLVNDDVQEVQDQKEADAIVEEKNETVIAVNVDESEITDEDVQVVADPEESDTIEEETQTSETVTNTDDDDVRVIGYGDIDVADNRSISVEELEINGQRVAIIDVDKDGVGDFAMSDLNHNQLADEGEVIDLHTGDVISFHNDQTAMEDMAVDADSNIIPA